MAADGRYRRVAQRDSASGRARDFIVTVGGKTISPSFIENALRASPYVAEAVVFGHGRKYLTAVIEIDFDTVADWARTNNVGYTGFTSLTTHPLIEKLMRAEIDRVNCDLARVEQIKSFRDRKSKRLNSSHLGSSFDVFFFIKN